MSDNKVNGVTKQCPWAPDNGVGQRCVSPPSVTRGLVFLWLGPVGFFYVIQKAQRPALAIAPGPRPSPANTSRSGHGPLSPGAAIWVPHTIPSDCDIRVQAIRVACVYSGDIGPNRRSTVYSYPKSNGIKNVCLILIIHNPVINLVYLLLLRGIIGCSTLISQRVTLKMLLSEYSLYKVVCIAQTDLVESKLQNLLSV